MRSDTLTKRLGLFLPSLAGGGAERVMSTLANAFVDRGIRVDLVLANAEGPHLPRLDPRVNILDLKCRRVSAAVRPLSRYLRRERPDALLSAMTHANVVAIAAHALAKVETRLVVSERVSLSNWKLPNAPILDRMLPLLVRWTYPRADHIVAVSAHLRTELVHQCQLPPRLVGYIYNPIDFDEIDHLAAATPDDTPFNGSSETIVLSAGRLTQQKDFTTLIKAFARLPSRMNLRLVILGEGPLRTPLIALARELGIHERFHLPGFIINPYAWMSRAAVFVLSSRSEGFPNALIEAGACGAPLISTNCPTGPSEILEDGTLGKLIPVGDVAAMADAIEQQLARPNTNRFPRERYRLKEIVDQWLQVLLPGLDHKQSLPSRNGSGISNEDSLSL